MKNLLPIFLAIILSYASAQTPKTGTTHTQACNLNIGDKYAGGIVFSLDSGDNCHGLVCAPSDQSTDVQWDQAVALCTSLRLGNHSDWRLPTQYELYLLYQLLYKNGMGHFATKFYWSSTTEYGGASAEGRVFAGVSIGGGQGYAASTGNNGAVRAIRHF